MFFYLEGSGEMNKKFFRYYMDNKPETDEDKYLFLVDNLEIAFNIIASGHGNNRESCAQMLCAGDR